MEKYADVVGMIMGDADDAHRDIGVDSHNLGQEQFLLKVAPSYHFPPTSKTKSGMEPRTGSLRG